MKFRIDLSEEDEGLIVFFDIGTEDGEWDIDSEDDALSLVSSIRQAIFERQED